MQGLWSNNGKQLKTASPSIVDPKLSYVRLIVCLNSLHGLEPLQCTVVLIPSLPTRQ